jgi:hypothetical protein
MAEAGEITIGIRVLDESKADMTQYVRQSDHEALRKQLRIAEADAAEWEDRYWELLGEHGGTA